MTQDPDINFWLKDAPVTQPIVGQEVQALREAAQRVLDRGYVSECIEEEREDYSALKSALAALSTPSAEPTVTQSDKDDDPACTDCDGTGITKHTERRCACQPAQAEAEDGLVEAIIHALHVLADAPDINPSNYDHEQVCDLNVASNHAWEILNTALEACSAPSSHPLGLTEEEVALVHTGPVTQPQTAGEWIEWNGGICPVDCETIIEYRLRWMRPDNESFHAAAGECRWDHGRTPASAADESLRKSDIIAYRVAALTPKSSESSDDLTIAYIKGLADGKDVWRKESALLDEALRELDVRAGDLFMLRKAIEAGDPKAELLVRVEDMLRETRAVLAKAQIKEREG